MLDSVLEYGIYYFNRALVFFIVISQTIIFPLQEKIIVLFYSAISTFISLSYSN